MWPPGVYWEEHAHAPGQAALHVHLDSNDGLQWSQNCNNQLSIKKLDQLDE